MLWPRLLGAEYHLTNGDIITGQPASISEDGVVFSLKIGGFSPLIRWTKFTQESLKELAKNPKAAAFADPFIEIPPEARQQEKKKEITIKPVENRLPRYSKVKFLEAWTSPAALMIVLMLYAANLYAAYEVSLFRNRPAALVCGLSAVLPVLGPLVFLSLPSLDEHGTEMISGAEPMETPAPAAHAVAAAPVMAGGGLGIAKAAAKEEPSGGAMTPAVFKRGDFTLNRRFVETKFSGFFRVVPTEAEKDLVLVVRTNKNEYIGKRISRISSNEMHVSLLRGGAEQMISFADITELQIRHKDAKA
ncbi:MAG: hypothetical protein L0Z50_02100 [Verrucomicrobiales bacterium]|nr:hypothetical protein [Verrucomicrobiales bacterium]